jgi:hypothetical protein
MPRTLLFSGPGLHLELVLADTDNTVLGTGFHCAGFDGVWRGFISDQAPDQPESTVRVLQGVLSLPSPAFPNNEKQLTTKAGDIRLEIEPDLNHIVLHYSIDRHFIGAPFVTVSPRPPANVSGSVRMLRLA